MQIKTSKLECLDGMQLSPHKQNDADWSTILCITFIMLYIIVTCGNFKQVLDTFNDK